MPLLYADVNLVHFYIALAMTGLRYDWLLQIRSTQLLQNPKKQAEKRNITK